MSIVSTLHGKMRTIASDPIISRSLALYGEWAGDELALLSQIITAESCVLDVGAFIGTHTIAFSQFVGPKGKVYSFEPRREIFTLLRENVEINNCSNVTLLNIGLAENNQELHLPFVDLKNPKNFGSLPLQEYSPSDLGTYEIHVSTIDDLGIGSIDLIKIDAEGMERRVLDGSIKSVSRYQPIIFCECNSLNSGAELLDFCNEQKYMVYAFLASAYNSNNFNKIKENIFGDSKELALLLVPKDKVENNFVQFTLTRLLLINTLEDLILPLLHKPQYAHEVLAKTTTGASLGISFPSPAIDKYIEKITALSEEIIALRKEISRIKATASWIITKPFRAVWNVLHSILPNDSAKR